MRGLRSFKLLLSTIISKAHFNDWVMGQYLKKLNNIFTLPFFRRISYTEHTSTTFLELTSKFDNCLKMSWREIVAKN